METTGKVIQILPLQEGVSQQGKAWALQGFVIETHEQYPRKVCIELFGKERIEKNLPKVDDDVAAEVDIESREFNGRWFTSVRAWRVSKAAPAAPAAAPMPTPPQAPTVPPASAPASEPTDSDNGTLPF